MTFDSKNNKRGTLHLICGPSGVGKSRIMPTKSEAYTYTTRPKRENERPGKDRMFVDNEHFRRLLKEGAIVVPYEYDGYKYGFARNLHVVLNQGRDVFEQMGNPDVVFDVVREFMKSGSVEPLLVFASFSDIKRRLMDRGGTPASVQSRLETAHRDIRKFLSMRRRFKKLGFNPPTMLRGREAKDKVRETLSFLERGILPPKLWNTLGGEVQLIWESTRRHPEQAVQELLPCFRSILDFGGVLIDDHVLQGPQLAPHWYKIFAVYAGDNDVIPCLALVPLAIALLLLELGDEAGTEEFMSFRETMANYMKDGLDAERNYITTAIENMSFPLFETAADIFGRKDIQSCSEEAICEYRDRFFLLYEAFRRINYYFLMERERFIRLTQRARLTWEDLQLAVSLTLSAEESICQMICDAFDEFPNLVNYYQEGKTSAMKRQAHIRQTLATLRPSGDLERWFVVNGEVTVLISLQRLTSACTQVVKWVIATHKKGRPEHVVRFVRNLVRSVKWTGAIEPETNIPAHGRMCLCEMTTFAESLSEILTSPELYIRVNDEEVVPRCLTLQNFLRKYFMLQTPDLNSLSFRYQHAVERLAGISQ